MTRFLVLHTLPPHAMTKDQVCQLADAAQHDSDVRGYRAFINLSEGRAACILEASDAATVGTWCKKMGLPYDSITPVEFEGERGVIHEMEGAAMAV